MPSGSYLPGYGHRLGRRLRNDKEVTVMRVDELIDTLTSLRKRDGDSLELPVIFKVPSALIPNRREIKEIKYIAGYSDRVEIQL